MKKIYFLVIVFLLTSLLVIRNSGASDKPKPIVSPLAETNGLSEAQAYRMLYDNQVKSNDSILKTIFYALGGLGTALVLVFASNWWFNEKKVADIRGGIDSQIRDAKNESLNEVRERIGLVSVELTSQANKIQVKLQEEVTANITAITLRFGEFTEKLRAEIKDDNKVLLENYQKQLDAFNENYKQQLSTLNDVINSHNGSLKELIEGKENAIRSSITLELNELKKKVARNEFYMWSYGGVMSNAMRAQLEELKLVLKGNAESEHNSFYLDQFSETVEKLTRISNEDKAEVIDTISAFPLRFKQLKEEILEKLGKVKIG